MKNRFKNVVIISLVTGATLFHGAGNLMAKDYLANQSAEFHGSNRNAATDSADIVNYNPAGTVFMADGLYVNIGTQYIYNKKDIMNYESTEYVSDYPAVIPSAFVVYKKNKFAFFGAFTVPAGGGKVQYKDGFPLMQQNLVEEGHETILNTAATDSTALLALGLIGIDATESYDFLKNYLDLSGTTVDWNGNLEGSSMYLAGTTGIAVKADNKLSLSAGVRAIYAINKFDGRLNYTVTPNAVRYDPNNDLNVTEDTVVNTIASTISGEDPVSDTINLDAELTAFGIGQVIGIDYKPTDKLLLAMRYETSTPLTWKEKVKPGGDFNGQYVNGRETHKDLPAIIAGGAYYNLFSFLGISVQGSYMFMKDSDAGEDDGNTVFGYDDQATNPWDAAVSVDFKPFKWLQLSTGYLYVNEGGNSAVYSDIDHALDWTSLGVRIAVTAIDNLTFNLAASHCWFQKSNNDAGENFKKEVDSVAMSVQYVFMTNSSSNGEDTDADDQKVSKKKEKKAAKEKKEKKTE